MTISTESVTDALRSDILAGSFPPGDRLVEVQLTDRYRCGRDAVRAAFVALESEGLITREAHRGATVRRISVEEAIQITEARAALESLVAAHAARNADDDDRSEIAAMIDRMEAAVAAADGVAYSELNHMFHRRLCEISAHTVAAALVDHLRNRSAHHQFRLASMPGRAAISLRQHGAIAAAVIAGDEPAAARAMEDHLCSVVAVLNRWDDTTRG